MKEPGGSVNQEQRKAYSEEVEKLINQELQKVLNAENQLEALKPHLDNVIVGEDSNKQAILVLLIGSKCNDVKKKQIVILKGTSGGGKTTVADTLSEGFRTKKIGRFSAHALDYSVLAPYEILYIQELLSDKDGGEQGISRLKFLSCDDKGYTIEYTVRAEGGGFTTKQRTIPPKTVLSTTVKLTLDRQFGRRAWPFNVDESKEQTKKIMKWKAENKQQETEVLLGTRKLTDHNLSKQVILRFLNKLTIVKATTLYPKTLSRVLGYNQLRVRGDIDKLYAFIELYAQFNKKRMKKFPEEFGLEKYYIPPEVTVDALKLLAEPLTNMLTRIDKRSKALIKALKEEGLDKASHGYVITKDARDKIAVKLGKSHNTIKSWLHNWCSAGVATHNNKKPLTFTLLYDVDVIKEKLDRISLKFKSFDDLIIEMRKEAQEFIKKLSKKKSAGSK